MPLATNPLIQVTPGLMIWTIVCFLIALWVLKRYAFGPIQKMIDQRQQSIRHSIEAADEARDEAQRLLDVCQAALEAGIDAASIAPSAAPAPTRVWISSMNRTMSPRVLISFKTFFNRSSKSPR